MCSRWRSSNRAVLAVVAAVLASCDLAGTNKGDTIASPGRLEQPLSVESDLQPGKFVAPVSARNPYEGDAAGIAEGRRLYHWYNCSGCHFNGGGGIGPAFLDGDWTYGGAPQNIYNSIMQGRPNGMPSYGGRVPKMQAWQIAAFVRSMDPDQTELEGGVSHAEGSRTEDEAPRSNRSSRREGGRN
jgi:cytochrome c oxidase cbb3-type subunit III